MQPLTVVVAFLASGAGASLLIALARGIYVARQERGPRRRVEAIRQAAETLALLEPTSDAAEAVTRHLDAEAAALAWRMRDRPEEGPSSLGAAITGLSFTWLAGVLTMLIVLPRAIPALQDLFSQWPVIIGGLGGSLIPLAVQIRVVVKQWERRRDRESPAD